MPAVDLQAQMQHMIDLQYEQQKQIDAEQHADNQRPQPNINTATAVPPHPSALAPSPPSSLPVRPERETRAQRERAQRSAAQATATTATTATSGVLSSAVMNALAGSQAPNNTINNSNGKNNSSSSNATNRSSYWTEYPDHGVGQGTLFFSTPSLSSKGAHLRKQQQSPLALNTHKNNNGPHSVSTVTMASLTHLPSYGTLQPANNALPPTTTTASNVPPPPPPAATPPSMHVQAREHNFIYGNPDYHDPFVTTNSTEPIDGRFYAACKRCCCLVDPLVHALQSLMAAEAWHRSFCYGAIDGMLTGSGIAATFGGLGLLSANSNTSVRSMVVVFTTATCFADSVCMALGHVWTTHVLSSAQARDRQQVRHQLRHAKADAKGALVDMLLAKGMLKIDAMSLADTLEGYPDLFISALTGDTLLSLSSGHAVGADGADHSNSESDLPPFVGGDNKNHMQNHGFTSYGRLSEYEMDPEAVGINVAVQESRRESFFMMLGFSLFAVLPSLMFLYAPVLSGNSSTLSTAMSSAASAAVNTDDDALKEQDPILLSPVSVVVSLTACIMWCLGVWKSRFLDSNWMLFGIETVVVLLVCTMSAFWLGALLNLLFLSDEYTLSAAAATTAVSEL